MGCFFIMTASRSQPSLTSPNFRADIHLMCKCLKWLICCWYYQSCLKLILAFFWLTNIMGWSSISTASKLQYSLTSFCFSVDIYLKRLACPDDVVVFIHMPTRLGVRGRWEDAQLRINMKDVLFVADVENTLNRHSIRIKRRNDVDRRREKYSGLR